MQQAKTKKSISVPEMGRMLGLGKVESYWLVKKNYFTTIQVAGRMRVMLDSFEDWYAGQFHYKKVGRPEKRIISPWQMAWENGCYYLIAYQDEKEPVGIRQYRVDRMSGVRVLELPAAAKSSSRISTCPPT